MSKLIELNGCIEVPDHVKSDFVIDKFIDFVESNNWTFGGGFQTIVDDFYVNDEGEKVRPVDNEYFSPHPSFAAANATFPKGKVLL